MAVCFEIDTVDLMIFMNEINFITFQREAAAQSIQTLTNGKHGYTI